MKVDPNEPVGRIAVCHREAIPVLEKYGIDFYIEGCQPLKDACYVCGHPLERVLADLEGLPEAGREAGPQEPDWSKVPTAALVDHIIGCHHTFARRQLRRIGRLLKEVSPLEEGRTLKFSALREVFEHMAGEFMEHMDREEDILFPLMEQEERARLPGSQTKRPSLGGRLGHDLGILLSDHGLLGREWRMIRQLTGNLRTPAGSGRRLKGLYRALRELERDNRRHIHLERNILFERAVQWGLLDAGTPASYGIQGDTP